jgi:hypothetical protein
MRALIPNTRAMIGLLLLFPCACSLFVINAYIGLTDNEIDALDQAIFGGLCLGGPVAAIGVLLLWHGRRKARTDYSGMIAMIKARGAVSINEIALEMERSEAEIKRLLYRAVHDGQFSGYINWETGVCYCESAYTLRGLERCPNCGGNITLAGRGIAHCRYCGLEFFLGQPGT